MTTYHGFTLLDNPIKNRDGAEPFKFARKMVLLDNKTGRRLGYPQSNSPRTAQEFSWYCETREQCNALRDFLEARRGISVPFWVPSYNMDMSLAVDMPDGAAGASILQYGYASQMFPGDGARRHIAIYKPGTTPTIFRQITAATDPGNGFTENITFDSPVAGQWKVGETVISYLHFCRLASDSADDNLINWYTRTVADAVLQFIDIPKETPL